MRHTKWAAACGLLLAVTAGAWAQGQGGPGGGFDPKLREQFMKFREAHKYTFQLTREVRAITEMDKGNKCPLKPAQAKKVLAVLKPLQKKPKLTQDQAKATIRSINAILETKQLNEVDRISADLQKRRGGMGGRPGGGPGGPGGPGAAGRGGPGGPGGRGPGGPGGRGPSMMQKDFNPFLPPKAGTPGAERYQRMKDTFADLEKIAKKK